MKTQFLRNFFKAKKSLISCLVFRGVYDHYFDFDDNNDPMFETASYARPRSKKHAKMGKFENNELF